MKVRTFVIDQYAIEIKNDSPDLHRSPVYTTNARSIPLTYLLSIVYKGGFGRSGRRSPQSVGPKGFFEVPGCHPGTLLEFPFKRDHLHETNIMGDPGDG